MSDFIGGMRQLLEDWVTPDLKAIQATQDAQYNASNHQHSAIMGALEAFRAEMRSEVDEAIAST